MSNFLNDKEQLKYLRNISTTATMVRLLLWAVAIVFVVGFVCRVVMLD